MRFFGRGPYSGAPYEEAPPTTPQGQQQKQGAYIAIGATHSKVKRGLLLVSPLCYSSECIQRSKYVMQVMTKTYAMLVVCAALLSMIGATTSYAAAPSIPECKAVMQTLINPRRTVCFVTKKCPGGKLHAVVRNRDFPRECVCLCQS
jgi:hypothetical protein